MRKEGAGLRDEVSTSGLRRVGAKKEAARGE